MTTARPGCGHSLWMAREEFTPPTSRASRRQATIPNWKRKRRTDIRLAPRSWRITRPESQENGRQLACTTTERYGILAPLELGTHAEKIRTSSETLAPRTSGSVCFRFLRRVQSIGESQDGAQRCRLQLRSE